MLLQVSFIQALKVFFFFVYFQHVDKVVQHKQLELQLAEAKMAQQSLQFNEMKEKSLIEKQEVIY